MIWDANIDDNTASAQIVVASGTPDLALCQPDGWSAPLVIGTSAFTSNNIATSFAPSNVLYATWAYTNCGTDTAKSNWQATVSVDGTNVSNATVTEHYSLVANAGNWATAQIGRLSAGPHQIKVVLDALNSVSELNESNNSYTTSFDIIAGKPNVAFCTLKGWVDSVVVGTQSDVFSNQPANFLPSDTIFISWAVTNNGNNTAKSNWIASIYDGSTKLYDYTYPQDIQVGSSWWAQIKSGSFAAGVHSISIILDPTNQLNESDLTDNTNSRSFYVGSGVPDLAYCQPTGWPGLVLFNNTSNLTDQTRARFTSADPIYISWAVTNQGTGAVLDGWKVDLLIDGVSKGARSCSQVDPGSLAVIEYPIAPLAVGSHSVKIVLDFHIPLRRNQPGQRHLHQHYHRSQRRCGPRFPASGRLGKLGHCCQCAKHY